jgi:hypothetical protein
MTALYHSMANLCKNQGWRVHFEPLAPWYFHQVTVPVPCWTWVSYRLFKIVQMAHTVCFDVMA